MITVLTLPPIIALNPHMSERHLERAGPRICTSQTGSRDRRSSHRVPVPRRCGLHAHYLSILIMARSSSPIEHDLVPAQSNHALQGHYLRVQRGVVHDYIASLEILGGPKLVPQYPIALAGFVGEGGEGGRHAGAVDRGYFEEVVVCADREGADPEEGREDEAEGVEVCIAEGHGDGEASRMAVRK